MQVGCGWDYSGRNHYDAGALRLRKTAFRVL